MVECKKSVHWGASGDSEVRKVWLIADSTPDPMPLNSDSVENMDDGVLFAPGSSLEIVGNGDDNGDEYLFNNGWYKSVAKGGGGGGDVSGKQDKYIASQVTIAPLDWLIDSENGFLATMEVPGVTATNLVQVAPAVDSIDTYMDYNIVCESQSADTLVFHAMNVSAPPAMNILVNIVIWG